ncbi:MAG: NUDIX hydrolase [Myxococcota bacterium]
MNASQLDALLSAHIPGDERESAHLARTLRLVRSSPEPFSRSQIDPGHITASAFVLSPNGTELLLIFHPFLRLWLQPGGHLEVGDGDVGAAARREVAEETGLIDVVADPNWPGLLDVDVHDIPANPKKGEGPHAHFDCRVLLRATTRQLGGGLDDHAARWVALDQVQDAGTDDSVRRAVNKLLERR